ncbi:MAG: T9SS type A sorting domain-containing protein [Bacteroidia bacterium]|nr:T9SS type A sorting domain-containing protein [Bacteroidia bacterium]
MKTICTTLLLTLTLFGYNATYASHLAGGQITWKCKPNGKYRFYLSLYQACEGGNSSQIGLGPTSLCVYNHPTINSITLNEMNNREISQPGCAVTGAIKCGNTKLGAMQEILYESADVDLGLYTPGINGWWFTYSNCCRPGAVVNVSDAGFTLRSTMYNYTNKNAYPCYDNSPMFLEQPVGIVAKGQAFSYNANATDADGDSVTTEWGRPMTDTWTDGTTIDPTACHVGTGSNHWKLNLPSASRTTYSTFNAPYTFSNPLSAIQIPPVAPATLSPPLLEPITGQINFVVPNTVLTGMYVFTLKTTSFRNGIKIAEVNRDFIFSVYLAQTDKTPTIAPVQFVKNGIADSTGYELNVNAGDLVEFDITAQDTIIQQQTLATTGLQYGTLTNYNKYDSSTFNLKAPCTTPPCSATATSGCGTPPCAQFSFTTPNPFVPTAGVTTGYGQTGGHFSWQTNCIHASNLVTAGAGGTSTQAYNTFQFVFKSIDDACPVPGFKYQTIRVNVHPVPPPANTITQTTLLCNGDSNATASLSILNNPNNYTTTWNTIPIQTGLTASNLKEGDYYVFFEDTVNNSVCGGKSGKKVTIVAPPKLTTTTTQNNLCNGNSNGTAIITATGGTQPYSYAWNTSPVQTNDTAINLPSGNTSCTVTDANGCTIVTNTGLAAVATSAINCNGRSGNPVVTVQGGNKPYTYSWNTTPVQTTNTAYVTLAGAYTCTVTDATSCTIQASVNVVNKPGLTVLNNTPVNCFEDSTGVLTVKVTGGKAPYIYNWYYQGIPYDTSLNLTHLKAGIYTFNITDGNNCTSNTNITVAEPVKLTHTVNSFDVLCAGYGNGVIYLTENGGNIPYNYSWNLLPLNNSSYLNNLNGGNYRCIITDAKGCADTANVVINEPLPLTLSFTQLKSCNQDASVTAHVTGGTPNYTYTWNTTPVAYYYIDSSAFTHNTGTYICKIRDQNSCYVTDSVFVNTDTSLFNVAINSSSCATCNNGSIKVIPTGGSQPYSYSINNGAMQADSLFTNLLPGSYLVTLADTNGCWDTATVILGYTTQLAHTINNISYKIYPSITSDKLNVEVNLKYNSPIAIRISSLENKQLYSTNFKSTTTLNEIIDVNELASGTYFITIQTNEDSVTRKFIKE